MTYYLKATITVSLSDEQIAAQPKSDTGFLHVLNLHCAAIKRTVHPSVGDMQEALAFIGYKVEVDFSGPAEPCCECGE